MQFYSSFQTCKFLGKIKTKNNTTLSELLQNQEQHNTVRTAAKSRTTQHCQNCSKIKNNTTLSELLQNQEQHNTVRTAPKFNQQIVEISKIDNPNTYS
jgi:Tfp pilus assembly protein PilE